MKLILNQNILIGRDHNNVQFFNIYTENGILTANELSIRILLFSSSGVDIEQILSKKDFKNSEDLIFNLVKFRALIVEDVNEHFLDSISSHYLYRLNWRGAISNYKLLEGYPGEKMDLEHLSETSKKYVLFKEVFRKKFDLHEFLTNRRSKRDFFGKKISFKTFSQLLYYIFYREDILKKNYPSGGAIHSLELYIIISNVEEIDSGLYYYDQFTHTLINLSCGSEHLSQHYSNLRKCMNVHDERTPNIVFHISSRYLKTTLKYPDIGLDLIIKEFGCLTLLSQQIATIMNLNCCPLGGHFKKFTDDFLNRGSDKEIEVGTICFGH
ncbi:SagB family peptide dehydrogenase [Flavobacterium saccharophilum]|uniref:SagB-type dehydrogenase domain-containing protein n=1 Tax=Flavobacterium saccharophilum TaxID=29534 RepID=A0A1M7MCH2_9FLAO|nr:SagB family peptide dehydrogenase [Flavobacterium saccharophilum]SHM88555.1 SagB-type dehydrogenase domain-containing protein [Flavobacterium saccharophilum]